MNHGPLQPGWPFSFGAKDLTLPLRGRKITVQLMRKDFLIPEQNLPSLRTKITKLLKKAEQTGLPVPQLSFGIALNERVKGTDGKPLMIRFRKIILEWQAIESAGWRVAGKLEHLPELNLVKSFGDEIPHHFRNAEPNCDHCNTKRRRLRTIVIQSNLDPTNFQQVGEDCLEEYLKVDSKNVMQAIKALGSIMDQMQAAEALPAIGMNPDMWPLEIYLGHVVEVIAEKGWVSRKAAREQNIPSTADLAYWKLTDNQNYKAPSELNIEKAMEAIQWADQIPSDCSDYLHNLHVIAESGAVEHRSLGYAASIITAYEQSKKGIQEKDSVFVGNVGDRGDFSLLVNKIIDIESQYGEQYIHIMSDKDDNVFVWKSKDRLDENRNYNLRGRIKEHRTFNGTNQTHIFYCKLATN